MPVAAVYAGQPGLTGGQFTQPRLSLSASNFSSLWCDLAVCSLDSVSEAAYPRDFMKKFQITHYTIR